MPAVAKAHMLVSLREAMYQPVLKNLLTVWDGRDTKGPQGSPYLFKVKPSLSLHSCLHWY